LAAGLGAVLAFVVVVLGALVGAFIAEPGGQFGKRQDVRRLPADVKRNQPAQLRAVDADARELFAVFIADALAALAVFGALVTSLKQIVRHDSHLSVASVIDSRELRQQFPRGHESVQIGEYLSNSRVQM
jgi:hypothetical protein